jgi:hypothetical protein
VLTSSDAKIAATEVMTNLQDYTAVVLAEVTTRVPAYGLLPTEQRPNAAQPRPGGALPHYVNTRWKLINANSSGHYVAVRDRLAAYADKIITRVDHGRFNPSP